MQIYVETIIPSLLKEYVGMKDVVIVVIVGRKTETETFIENKIMSIHGLLLFFIIIINKMGKNASIFLVFGEEDSMDLLYR